jgi:hypothetical protein
MPFKFNAARRHRIPRARYRVQNWPQYEAGLKRRGDLTLWIDEAAIAGWQAPRRTTPGGQARYSDLAIQLVLTLRLVFHLALRQAEAFAGRTSAAWARSIHSRSHHLKPAQPEFCRTMAAYGVAWSGAFGDRQHRIETVWPGRVE